MLHPLRYFLLSLVLMEASCTKHQLTPEQRAGIKQLTVGQPTLSRRAYRDPKGSAISQYYVSRLTLAAGAVSVAGYLGGIATREIAGAVEQDQQDRFVADHRQYFRAIEDRMVRGFPSAIRDMAVQELKVSSLASRVNPTASTVLHLYIDQCQYWRVGRGPNTGAVLFAPRLSVSAEILDCTQHLKVDLGSVQVTGPKGHPLAVYASDDVILAQELRRTAVLAALKFRQRLEDQLR